MHHEKIDVGQTHIRLTTDRQNHDLTSYVYALRSQIKSHILSDRDFLVSLEPLENDDEDLPAVVSKMYESSAHANVGPMACVAGSISEFCLNRLIGMGSAYSIVENGGDIALVNDRRVLCGIFSNNQVLGNGMAFEIRPRKNPLGICTSSGKIGHSISFGIADSVTVIAQSPSVADGLATGIANEVKGEGSEDRLAGAAEYCENFREFFEGVLIISDDNVATVGRLPKIVETNDFSPDM